MRLKVKGIGDLEIQFETIEFHEEEQKVQHGGSDNSSFKDDDIQYSESSSSTDYDHLEQERLWRKHSFAWNPPEDFREWDEKPKEQEGTTQKESLEESLAVPETSSETTVEKCEIVNNKKTFTLCTGSNTEKHEIPNQNQIRNKKGTFTNPLRRI